MSESFADLFNESLQRSEMRTGEVITAEVVRISERCSDSLKRSAKDSDMIFLIHRTGFQ